MRYVPTTLDSNVWARLSALICVVFTLGLFSLIYFNLDKGFNFSDESMYLYCITFPQRLWALMSDFGAFLHPIFMALGQDVYKFRVITFLALIISSAMLIISFLLLCKRHVKLNAWNWVGIYFSLWSCIVGYYTLWLPTPSYNTLALIGIFGVLTSLIFYTLLARPFAHNHILSNKQIKKYLTILTLLFLSIFGVLTFIGKMTTGAAIGVIAGTWIFFTNTHNGKIQWKESTCHVAAAGLVAIFLLVVYFFLISGGLDSINKILLSAKHLDNTYSFDKTVSFYLQYFFPTSYVVVFITWPLWAFALWATQKEQYKLALGIIGITIIFTLISSYIWIINYIPALVMWPLLVVVFMGACIWRKSWKHLGFGLRLALAFFCASFAYHAGTNTSLEFKMSEALILPALAVISLCMPMLPTQRNIVLPIITLILCCMSFGSLVYSIFEPARNNDNAMWQLTEPVVLIKNTQPILVHQERKAFINWLRATTQKNNWKAGNPLINTSYYTSGSLFLIDAYKMESIWQIEQRYTPRGSYSVIMSQASSEDLKRAWIIKPVNDGPRHMPSAVLKEIGLPFPEGYELLGTSPPESIEGIWPAEQYEMWKPKN